MFQNYLKITTRVLLRNKVYSIVNILGLAMGIAAFLLILEYVGLGKSVNQFHTKLPQMHRLLCQSTEGDVWPQVEPGWSPKVKERLPEVEDFCRFTEGIAQGIVSNQEQALSFREENIGYAEGNFFEFFSFPLRAGDAADFHKPDVVFISESASNKYFGAENPVGKPLRLYNQFGDRSFVVAGVFKDMSENSDIRFDMLFSLETLKNPANLNGNGWASLDNLDNQYIHTFLLLTTGTDLKALEQKLNAMRRELQPEKDAVVFRLQPFRETYLATSLNDDLPHSGNLRHTYMLIGIALLILLIAWFNYVNLSTATIWRRANEVGVRKAIGASRTSLMGQLLGESMLLNALAFGAGLLLVQVLQPFFNDMIGNDLSISVLSETSVWLYGLVGVLLGALLSGAYSAFILSGFSPVDVLKGRWAKGVQGVTLRKSLVVSQFSISITLILFTILVYSQLHYMQHKDLGMKPEQLLVVKGPEAGLDSTFKSRQNAYWDEVSQQNFVSDYCTSGSVPGHSFNFATEGFTSPQSKPGDENKSYSFAIIGDRYLKTYGIALAAGRNFTPEECAVRWNDNDKVLMNERAVAQLRLNPEDALHTKIRWDERYLSIIGVVKDYHHSGLQQAIEPIIFYPQNNTAYFTLHMSDGNLQGNIATLERLYKTQFPGNPFEYFFVDDNFNQQYLSEKRYSALFSTASIWAIFIACMGLFGLATFTVESRTKEIGVRKVLGASVASITSLLAKDFLTLVFIAVIIASPIAYFFMDSWLSDFAYRIDIQWWMFALAAALTAIVAFLTVGVQSVKAALANPVKSLRSE